MAAAAAATGGAALAAGAASAAGGASAVMAAFSKANENVSVGTDVMSAFLGGGRSGGSFGGEGSNAGTGGTPFAQAAGFSGSSGGGSSSGGSSTSASNSSGSSKGGDKAGAGGQGSSSTASTNGADKAAKNEPKPADVAGKGQQGAPGSTGPGLLASAASALGTAGRIAADASANLAKGTAEVAKGKAVSLREAAGERIADTIGGKIAAAIREQGSSSADTVADAPAHPAPTFSDNSLAAGSSDANLKSEVAAFANRDQGRNGTTA
jgi:type IV secretion system protein VirB6/type IV secretion system protein TrbL